MNKYSGSFTILDDQGNVVYERELTSDEIVGSLISHINAPKSMQVDPNLRNQEDPSKKRGRPKGLTSKKEKKANGRVCSNCGKPGHNSRGCPDKKGERVPNEAITTDEGSFYKINDNNDIHMIWDCVDVGLREYDAIAKRLGFNPLAVKEVLMNPRP